MRVESPRLDAEVLLAHSLKARREDLILHPDRVLDENVLALARERVSRRMRREPVSHILGYREFWSRPFKVNSHVLDPRPETEHLIEQMLNRTVSRRSLPWRLLDLGTGSGILAITLLLELPNSHAVAVDISAEALEVARENVRVHRVEERVHWIQGDLFEGVSSEPFDFILSNPPYIPSERLDHLAPEVRKFEPHRALDGGGDGLSFYRRIVPNAPSRMKPGAWLIMEIGDDQGEAVTGMLQNSGTYTAIQVIQDYSRRDRVVLAQKETHG